MALFVIMRPSGRRHPRVEAHNDHLLVIGWFRRARLPRHEITAFELRRTGVAGGIAGAVFVRIIGIHRLVGHAVLVGGAAVPLHAITATMHPRSDSIERANEQLALLTRWLRGGYS